MNGDKYSVLFLGAHLMMSSTLKIISAASVAAKISASFTLIHYIIIGVNYKVYLIDLPQ